MPRTTPELVSTLVEISEDVPADTAILTANEIVTEVCTSFGYTDQRLELIERWLSAHFYSIREQVPAMEKAGEVSVSYQYTVGLLFHQTKYGQQALMLDTKGGLARLQKAIKDGRGQSIQFLHVGAKPKKCK